MRWPPRGRPGSQQIKKNLNPQAFDWVVLLLCPAKNPHSFFQTKNRKPTRESMVYALYKSLQSKVLA